MTIAERYGKATRSSHLEMTPEPGDLDLVIAAGMADRLGILLLRCRQEWDASRADHEQAERNARAGEHLADLEAKTAACGPTREASIRQEVREQTLRSRALILINLGSLASTRVALLRHAAKRSSDKGLVLDRRALGRVVGSALDIWLDQRCDACEGRGKNGGYGAPQLICVECKGTKVRRRVLPAESNDEFLLGVWLVAEADRLVADATQAILRNKGKVEARKQIADDMRRKLQQRVQR